MNLVEHMRKFARQIANKNKAEIDGLAKRADWKDYIPSKKTVLKTLSYTSPVLMLAFHQLGRPQTQEGIKEIRKSFFDLDKQTAAEILSYSNPASALAYRFAKEHKPEIKKAVKTLVTGKKEGPEKQYQRNPGTGFEAPLLYAFNNLGSASATPNMALLSFLPDRAIEGMKLVFGVGDKAQTFGDYIKRNYTDAGSTAKNFLRYTPWQQDKKKAQQLYVVPDKCFDENGNLRSDPESRRIFSEKFQRWKKDAEAHGYSGSNYYFNLFNTTKKQRDRNKAQTETNSILPIYTGSVQYFIEKRKIEAALKNPASQQQRQILLKQKQQLEKNWANLKEQYNNLPLSDQIRFFMTPASAAAAVPAAVATAKHWVPFVAIEALARGLSQTGQQIIEWKFEDLRAVQKALYTGKFDGLSDSQKKLLQENISQGNVNIEDPASRVALANTIQKKIQTYKDYTDNGVTYLTYALPAGRLAKGVKSVFGPVASSALPKQTFGRAAWGLTKETGKGAAGMAIFDQGIHWAGKKLFPSFFKDEEEQRTPYQAALELPSDKKELQKILNSPDSWQIIRQEPQGSSARRIIDAFTFGLFSKGDSLVRSQLGIPMPYIARDITQGDLAKARLELGEGATPQQVYEKAKDNIYIEAAKQKALVLQKEDVDKAKTYILGQFNNLSSMSSQERKKKLKQVFSGTGDEKIPPQALVAVLNSLGDQSFVQSLVSKVGKTPQQIAQFMRELKEVLPASDTSISSDKAALIESFKDAAIKNLGNKYLTGLQKAEDKFAFVESWTGVFNEAEGLLGESLEDSPLMEHTKQILWDEVMKNPFKNLHKALSLLARKAGYSNLADFIGNPWAFYGTLFAAVPLTVMLMRSLFGGNDDDEGQQEQRPTIIQNIQYPAQHSISDRGLFAGQ